MARIVINRVIGISGAVEAEMVVHTDVAPWNVVPHPLTPGTTMPMLAFLQLCKTNPAVRAAAGYNAPSHVPGKTQFDLLLASGEV